MNKRIKELEEKINKARNDYYNYQSIISDKIFDAWVDELKLLDPNNIAVTTIGAAIIPTEWEKAKHQIQLGSLDKVNLPNELSKWVNDVAINENLWVTEKLDGLSIELIYDHGSLSQAITRGNGLIGEEISANVINMGGVYRELYDYVNNSPNFFTGSLRGEIIMTKSNHKKYFADKSNPRNAASGVSKRLDGVGCEHLDILFYQVIGDEDFASESDQFEWLIRHKIKTPNFWLFKNADEVNEHWRKYQDEKRDKLDYEIDGLVVCINDLEKQENLGETNLRPHGKKAFKFDNETRESIIRKIDFQTGNSGRLTPVATFDQVTLVGADITRASLYNMAYVNQLGIDIGATVLVSRANDVIPKIEELVLGTGTVLQAPANCPICNGKVEMIGENLQCLNILLCPAQVNGRIFNWINELNLLEWGESLVNRLVESKKVVTVADLYKLTIDDLADIDRMGKKSAKKCYDILWGNSEISLEIFLGGLSIPMIGQSTIKLIMNEGCDTLEKFGQLNLEDFEKVPGVGPIRAKSLFYGLRSNKDLIMEILDCGVTIKTKINGPLTNKSITFTGPMVNKRSILEKMAAEAGADVKSSVSKGLTYLVISDINSASSKAVSAKKLGTALISENDFLKMVNK